MAGDAAAMQAWIACRISETRFLAEEARAVVHDIEDRVVLDATVQLAQDLERFAARLAARLAEVDSIKPVSPTGTTR
jgi:hypothetical protein